MHLLLQHAVVLLLHLLFDDGGKQRRVGARLLQLLTQLLLGDVDRLAQVHRVERLHILGDDHQVVGGLVVHQQRVVAVVDESARRGDGDLADGVALGGLLVAVVHHLQAEQLQHARKRDEQHAADDDDFSLL